MSTHRIQGRPRVTGEQGDQLLPGIPNDITMNHIVTNLQWRVLHVLSLVSHGWREAIRSHEVHDARVFSESTDTVIAIHAQNGELFLYSVRDKYYCQLPEVPVPGLCKEEAHFWRWIPLDGKVYVLGGLIMDHRIDEEYPDCSGEDLLDLGGPRLWKGSSAVYVLDLAGPRVWKQCASMVFAREDFGCGTINGKIYVFGGVDGLDYDVHGAEVYDPKEDSWSAISSDKHGQGCAFKVAALGEELFLCGGYPFDKDTDGFDHSWGVYHPVKDEWRIVRALIWENVKRKSFYMNGVLYMMTKDGMDGRIDVYNYITNTWSDLHSGSFAGVAGVDDSSFLVHIVGMKDELLVVVRKPRVYQPVLLQSGGFRGDKKNLVWQRVNCPVPIEGIEGTLSVICNLQL